MGPVCDTGGATNEIENSFVGLWVSLRPRNIYR